MLLHNYLSSDIMQSQECIAITKNLVEAGKIWDNNILSMLLVRGFQVFKK